MNDAALSSAALIAFAYASLELNEVDVDTDEVCAANRLARSASLFLFHSSYSEARSLSSVCGCTTTDFVVVTTVFTLESGAQWGTALAVVGASTLSTTIFFNTGGASSSLFADLSQGRDSNEVVVAFTI